MSIHLFGIRHHGPGSSRSLVRALGELKPDVILLEGPPEGQEMLSYVAHPQIQPPVALLIYAADSPKRACYYPFAEFSPEWQTIKYGLEEKVPVRFMDLPQTHQLLPPEQMLDLELVPEGLVERKEIDDEGDEDGESEDSAAEDETAQIDPEVERRATIRRDPLGYAARAAGFTDGERWWDRMVEMRASSPAGAAGIFEAVHELMTALREETGPNPDPEERLREAYMRQTLRAAQKEGFNKIAVVCGAWHTPALAKLPPAKEDAEILRGLPKAKVVATWIPWTYDRLSRRSGYGAGVRSPGWYEHLWETQEAVIPRWMTKTARCFRETGIDISPAHAIEASRLAEALATLRLAPLAGLAEVSEAVQTVFCFGSSTPMALIEEKLIVGERLGVVPDDIPKLPLVQDVAKEQKRLRLPPKVSDETLDLDLRKPNDLDRSCLLHRLNLLGMAWGKKQDAQGKVSTFHELWKIRWHPEFAVDLVEASVWGNSVVEAATGFMTDKALKTDSLPELTKALDQALEAQLGDVVTILLQRVEEVAAQTSDVPHLMQAMPPLVNVQRYGDVRKTDTSAVAHVIKGLVVRICIGLQATCSSLDDDASEAMCEMMGQVDQSIRILNDAEQRGLWHEALGKISEKGGTGGLVSGRTTRLLFDASVINPEQLETQVGLALAPALPATQAGAWAEGLLRGSGLLLLHHPELLGLIDDWVRQLSPDTFTALLPLLRRTFATFPTSERRQMGEKLTSGDRLKSKPAEIVVSDLDLDRAKLVVPVISTIFGLKTP